MRDKIFRTLVFSNLFIALVALAMLYRTDQLWGLHLSHAVYVVIFFSTLLVYSIHSIASTDKDHIFRGIWNQRNRKLLYVFSGVSSIGIIYLLLSNPTYFISLSPVALLTAYYIFPRFDIKALSNTRVYFKTLILTVVWLYSTSIFPIIISEKDPCSFKMLSFFAVEFVFLYLICFFFDHRDRKTDPQHYIFFNPHRYPSIVVYAFASLFFIAITVAILFKVDNLYLFLKSILMLFVILTYKKSITTNSDVWFYLILDGLMGADAIIFLIR